MRGIASLLVLGIGLGLTGCTGASPSAETRGKARSGLGEQAPSSPPAELDPGPSVPVSGCSRSVLDDRAVPATLPPLPDGKEGLRPMARLPAPGPVTGLALTDDGQRVVIVGPDRVSVWRPSPPEGTASLVTVPSPEDDGWCATEFPALRDRIARTREPSLLRASAAVDLGGSIAAVAGHDGVLRVYDLASFDAEGPVRTVDDTDVEHARIVWGGQMTVTAGVEGVVAREVVSSTVRWKLEPPSPWSQAPRALAISPDAEWVGVVDPAGKIWRARAGQSFEPVDALDVEVVDPQTLAIDAHGKVVASATGPMSLDGRRVALGDEGGARVTDVEPGAEWVELVSAGEIRRVAISRRAGAVALDVGDEIAVYRLSDAPAAP